MATLQNITIFLLGQKRGTQLEHTTGLITMRTRSSSLETNLLNKFFCQSDKLLYKRRIWGNHKLKRGKGGAF